jgi:GH18 family chitinase
LTASGTQQFTAAVLGASNTAVTWSIIPSLGTISSQGLYTAPSGIPTSQTVTVKGQSVADPTKSASGAVSLQATPGVKQWSIGYYSPIGNPALPVAAIQWSGLTHVVQWEAMVNPDGKLDLSTEEVSSTAAALVTAAHANNVKALLTIGQIWSGPGTEIQQAVSSNLSALVTNIMTVVNTYGYDGVDIDWEPFVPSTNGSAMTALAQALRTALGNKLLTVAVEPNVGAYWATNHTPFDRVNVMTYDLGGTGHAMPYLGFNSPLYDTVVSSLDQVITGSVQGIAGYVPAGVPASKVGIGIPFYGAQWTGGAQSSNPSLGVSGPRQSWVTWVPSNMPNVLPTTDITQAAWEKGFSSTASSATTWLTGSSGSAELNYEGVPVAANTRYTVSAVVTGDGHPGVTVGLTVYSSGWSSLCTCPGTVLSSFPTTLECEFNSGSGTTIVMGLGTYGALSKNVTITLAGLAVQRYDSSHQYTIDPPAPNAGTEIAYHDIAPIVAQYGSVWDSSGMVPYIGFPGTPSTSWYLSYDDAQSVQAKVRYAINKNLGGWIIWHIGMDYMPGDPHPHPLLDAVQAGRASAN